MRPNVFTTKMNNANFAFAFVLYRTSEKFIKGGKGEPVGSIATQRSWWAGQTPVALLKKKFELCKKGCPGKKWILRGKTLAKISTL